MGALAQKPGEDHPDAGRRKLLKVVAAGGGVVAASLFVPASWIKPVVDLGVLPADAGRGSGVQVFLDEEALRIVGPGSTDWALDARNAACDTTPRFVVNGSDGYHASCSYTDPLGEFDPLNWTLFTREAPCNIVHSRLICSSGDGGFYINGDVYSGDFNFYKIRECNGSTGLWWWVKKGTRTSNQVFVARPTDPE